MGQCIVDRVSGLPVDVRLNRVMTIQIQTEEGHEVTQEKEILTTIRAFPEIRESGVRERTDLGVRQTSSRRGVGEARQRAVQATYPGQ